MANQAIIRFRGLNIVPVILDGALCVSIKLMCDAFGIEYESEVKRIKADEIISSTLKSCHVEGAPEGKQWVLCMPIEYLYGWLYTITPGIVPKFVRDAINQYRIECFKALYEHFSKQRTEGSNPLMF